MIKPPAVVLFNQYFRKWSTQTGCLSSVGDIVNNENFQAIVNMRETAVPFIVEKIKEGPTLLIWALNLIYNKEVAPNPNTPLEQVGKLWLKELKL
jgi:hypothetical protein